VVLQTFHALLLKAATSGANSNQPIGAGRALVFNVSTDAASMGGYAAPPWVGMAYRCSKVKEINLFTVATNPAVLFVWNFKKLHDT
jgi:hypothetical protein